MNRRIQFFVASLSLLLSPLLVTGCSGGGSNSAQASQGGFQLIQTNVMNNEVWAINRAITFTFNEQVDFATVSMNTMNIQTSAGQPAVGTFTTGSFPDGSPDPNTVVFQPSCPTLSDLSDAGFEPGGIPYVITVRGLSGGTSNVVRSITGRALATTQSRTFSTPVALDPTQAFIDTVPGPPVPIVRTVGSSELAASYLEVGGSQRIYFEVDESTGNFTLSTPGFQVPLNLYSDPDSAVAAILEFNQALDPSAGNISPDRLRIEVRNGVQWIPIDSEVELVQNCSATGATVRIEPRGILPPGDGMGTVNFRVVVLSGFQDVVGDTNLVDINDFGLASTRAIAFNSLTPADDEADEVFADFLLSGDDFGSLEDTDTLFDAPRVLWGEGRVESAFEFDGNGGPNGNFDYIVGSSDPNAQENTEFFNTVSQQVFGGPGGVQASIQNSTNGVFNVRNMIIEANTTVSAIGPNPFIINATGDVIIRGTLSVNGTSAKDVATLNSGNVPEQGGAGQAGGGRGGDASTVVNASTPSGSPGTGPFNAGSGGGEGGESQYAPGSAGKNARRPGGGGGGAHSLPQLEQNPDFEEDDWPSITGNNDTVTAGEDPNQGLVARRGLSGTPGGTSAVTNAGRALGGLPGPLVFNDERDDNNFFGVRAIEVGGQTDLILGEGTGLLPGTGGGGGGDAVASAVFPHPNWNPGTDEKGAGGGGGAGALRIRALGRIIVTGQISANGGQGGVGENVIFLDHIGGGGGGGSGGHIILESASKVYLGTDPTITGEPTGARDVIIAEGGRANFGDFDSATAVNNSIGGQGGPGLIQIHVPNSLDPPNSNEALTDVVLAPGASNDLDRMTRPEGVVLVPTFSKRSIGQSKWLSIGSADIDPTTGGQSPVTFLFDGVDPGMDVATLEPGEGLVNTVPGVDVNTVLQEELAPVLGVAASLDIDGTNVSVSNGSTLTFSGAGLDEILVDSPENDVYLRTPTLLNRFLVRIIRNEGMASELVYDYEVVQAAYDDDNAILTMDVEGDSTLPEDVLVLPGTTSVGLQVIPRYFLLSSQGLPGQMPASTTVTIQFQGTGADLLGNPDTDNILQDWTGDLSALSAQPAGELRFFRFRVEFDLDAMNAGLSADTQTTQLDFMRIPFRF